MAKTYSFEDRNGTMFIVHHDTTAGNRLWYETKIKTVEAVRSYGKEILGVSVERILTSGYFIKILGRRIGVSLVKGTLTPASFIENMVEVSS
jgi:hypothetical protein